MRFPRTGSRRFIRPRTVAPSLPCWWFVWARQLRGTRWTYPIAGIAAAAAVAAAPVAGETEPVKQPMTYGQADVA